METKNGISLKILYADDDPDDRKLFQDALKDAHVNAQLLTVEDGNSLMQYLTENNNERPDIIFLDINMPWKDGKLCLKEIRAIKEFNEIPVVMFSTSSHQKDIKETFESGANLYVSKPVFYHDEVKVLQQIFSLDWQKELLKPDRKRFVIQDPSTNNGKYY